MPFVRAILGAPPLLWRMLSRIASALLVVGIAAASLFAALLLLVRFVVFPQIDHYRDTIVQAIAAQVHQPVAIARLSTGWDGWNPKLVISGFRIGAPASGETMLELPRVELTIAWTSLTVLDLRLKQLSIESPHLAIRRDRNGLLHVAGLEIDLSRQTQDVGLTDWLLRQREIVISDALVTWTDEQRAAPQLVLDHVNFRLDSRFGRHRFGLTGRPPAELAAPIDIRGDLRTTSARDWRHAEGRLYARLDYADVGAWREWLPLPREIGAGKGALRAWFTFAGGEATEVIADLELADVRTRLAPDLPELALRHVAGRAGWRFSRSMREIFGRGLSFTTPDGRRFEPTNLSLQLHTTDSGQVARGRLEYDRLQLAPLRDLAAHLPLPEAWRADLRAAAPQGILSRGVVQWQGPIESASTYAISTDFSDVGVAPRGEWPGATGLHGNLNASEKGGNVKLATGPGSIALPHVFAHPIALDSAQAEVTWARTGATTLVRIADLAFANADAAGRLRATYRQGGTQPADIDLEATLTRASVAALPRYVPVFLSEDVQDWLGRAIRPGQVDAATLKLKGDPERFPFADGKSGTFSVDVKGRGFGLDYAAGWPAFSDIDGEVHFRDAGVKVAAARARLFGIGIGKVSAEIKDLRAPVVDVEGDASGATRDFVRFVEESPVGEWIGHALAGAQAGGDGRLSLKLVLPLHDLASNRITGEYVFVNNQLKLTAVPALARLNGRVAFTDSGMQARDVTADALGGPVKIAIASGEGLVRVRAVGNASLPAVRREFDLPLASRLAGSADWTFALDTHGDASSWVLESSLKGAVLTLPAPLGKAAAEILPLRIERHAPPPGATEDTLLATFGDVARVALHRSIDHGNPQVDAALVSLGAAMHRPDASQATRRGLWVRAISPALDIDQWLAVKRESVGAAGEKNGSSLVLAGLDLDVGALTAFGREFADLRVVGRQIDDAWSLELAGHDVAGQATWSAPSASAPNGRIVARLARFVTPKAKPLSPEGGSGAAGEAEADAGASAWPELDVAADSFTSSGGHELGRLELVAKPRNGEWRIDRLVVANDAGRLDATGAWRAGGRPEETQLDVALDVSDAGAFLARLGHAGMVQRAPTKITGHLAWAGAPSDFDYPTLSGAFRIDVGSGRFMKIEPGLGKLLGVLSLQALPRRISLDFRDVFSEGFTFDRVSGNVRIARGVMTSDDLHLSGPSAQITITGDADLAEETQRLRVRVQPTLTAGVSAGAALLFLANPIVGAAVGAGSLLAQKMLRDPVEQMFSYEYQVTGSWSDPHVSRGRMAPGAVASEPSNK